jgi:DNA polymerase
MKHLHIDIETYSSVDIKKSGVYKYADSLDFEILCIAWSYGDTVHCCPWNELPQHVVDDLEDPSVKKFAHNATFERVCLSAMGLNVGNDWLCTAVLAGYNGLPMSLKDLSSALELGDSAKDTAGPALIRYFCMPCKATKANGGRTRNLPEHDAQKWNAFMAYCRQDVVAEMGVYERLKQWQLPEFEQRLYAVDQMINQNGVQVDVEFIDAVLKMNTEDRAKMNIRAKEITGLSNPNSIPQIRKWIEEKTGEEVLSLTKQILADLNFPDHPDVMELLDLRKRIGKTSIKKYDAMLKCVMDDGRVRGLFQYYGANRTGRWAGRLVQVQNLPRNYIDDLDATRALVKRGEYDTLVLLFNDVQDTLAQLIRTSFIPAPESTHLTLSDYSAIEARVLAWLSGEKWRMEVFRSKEKKDIYKESASRMFGIPMDQMDFHNRRKGKLAELVLGYQGGVSAVVNMDAQSTGLTNQEIKDLVVSWRKANKSVVNFWYAVQEAATKSIKNKKKVEIKRFIFETDDDRMTIQLPSGRKLSYWKARVAENRYGKECIQYMWQDSNTRKWTWVDSYGGKLVENLTQAVARDFMAEAVVRVHERGFRIVMHIHDEIVVENGNREELENIMKELPDWAEDFPLEAKGEVVAYFQK